MHTKSNNAATGVTLVELLLALAIIGLLASLSIPAIQHSRETARNSSCANNLRQFGLAFSSFESARGIFPSSLTVTIRGPVLLESEWAFHSYASSILPYCGAPGHVLVEETLPFSDPKNAKVAGISLPISICPATPVVPRIRRTTFVPSLSVDPVVKTFPPLQPLWSYLDAKYATHYDGAYSDYGIITGAQIDLSNRHGYDVPFDQPGGLPSMFPVIIRSKTDAFEKISKVLTTSQPVQISNSLRARDISDGLSKTLMYAEMAGLPEHWVNGRRVRTAEPLDAPWVDIRAPRYLEPGADGESLISSDNDVGLFSFHPGHVNILFADGHVIGASSNADVRVVLAWVTPAMMDMAKSKE